MNQFLIAICGIPASGKTMLSNAIVRQCGCRNVHVVSTDDWRDEEYYQDFLPENEQAVRKFARDLTTELIQKGHSVIHDDTNYYKSMRHELFNIAREKGCIFTVVYISTPIETAKKWNRARDFVLPDDVIAQIAERLDVPGGKYAWDNPIIKVDLSMISVDDAASEIVDRLEVIEPLAEIETKPHAESRRRLLDIVTRQTVARFLKEFPEYRKYPEVHSLRKEVLKEAGQKEMDAPSTEEQLWKRLTKLTIRVS